MAEILFRAGVLQRRGWAPPAICPDGFFEDGIGMEVGGKWARVAGGDWDNPETPTAALTQRIATMYDDHRESARAWRLRLANRLRFDDHLRSCLDDEYQSNSTRN